MIRLDILSDIACPWCYVGKAYLDRALEAHPEHPFVIEWHPYQLNPEMPKEGMDRRAYMEAKFGGREGAARADAPLVSHAAEAGIELNLDRVQRAPNTLDAHRLIHWAGFEGRQTAMVSALFRALWRDGRDVGDADTLADIAGEVGLDRDMMRRLLDGDGDVEEIRARIEHARERGVNAVPTFIIAERHVLQGAQPTATWGKIVEELSERIAELRRNSET
ncbi:DsbA family oxidoreductase [Defluviimonas salinarum]|uniref:DsbA family oxidoreductase n=1 Tax=Defluviimonas salinarum TaxID=2992147 RepID=A0ABT3J0B4_9RHOB|nr:DsbA family oxidoreductase [Defluviimonas salinarum]MCW3781122.1 DsbA family oxidoreductase [Defluviimonas salinarum]